MGVRVIYADVLFFINFTVDFLCMFLAAALLSARVPLWRTTLSALAGGAYSVAWAALPYFPAYIALPAHLTFALLMTFIAFGRRRFSRLCAACAVFALCEAFTGGLVGAAFALTGGGYVVSGGVYAELSPAFVLAVAAFSVGACYLYGVLCRRRLSLRSVTASIVVEGVPYKATLCVDTGFHVLDPVTGEPVMLVSSRVFGGEKPRTNRLIPFTTASGGALLEGFRPQAVKIGGEEVAAVIAVSGKDEYYRGCDGLIPPLLARGN